MLYDNEVRISKEGQLRFDKTQFKLMRALLRYGFSRMAPWMDKMDLLKDENKFVSNAMQVARGGHDSDDRGSYGDGAWYTSQKSEEDCNYRCFVEEYTTIMALWTERQPVSNNKRVIRQACEDWTNLGGMWACHLDNREFDPGERDNGMRGLFNDNSWVGDWHEGFLRPPVKEYG